MSKPRVARAVRTVIDQQLAKHLRGPRIVIARYPRKGQKVVDLEPRTFVQRHGLKYHPVLLELRQADASFRLLELLDAGNIDAGDDARKWIHGMALDKLGEALKRARAEFVKAAEIHQAAL
jgi:hypothetical protein